jgi:hypothetical protein
MSSLVRIATVELSSRAVNGLNGYLTTVEEFAAVVCVHSGQTVFGERQDNNDYFLFCPDDEDFKLAENSARMLESFVRPHVVRFMDGKPSFLMQHALGEI